MTPQPQIVRGTNDKPVASQALADILAGSADEGQVFIGYPVLGSPDGRRPIDAVYASKRHGLVVFDLVDGTRIDGYQDRQDEAATRLSARLLTYKELTFKRALRVRIHSVTFAPAVASRLSDPLGEYPLANDKSLLEALDALEWPEADDELYARTVSALQSISTIRKSRGSRPLRSEDSKGAKLQKLEDSIATLDNRQSKAVIETVDGVQRIRGLAGSGKTIILALKAAYLHASHPDWRIAVTFNTRSLKGHFSRLINTFSIEQTGEEPNWKNLRVVNAWGAPGGDSRDGIYHEFCRINGLDYLDFNSAQNAFNRDNAFEGVLSKALSEAPTPTPAYDAILADEAQDFPPQFLRMCYSMLNDKKRLVYAYDELQNLSGNGVLSAEELFGLDSAGQPRVTFSNSGGPQRDIILEKCYRNSRPVLTTAHALGFGIYRRPPRENSTGLVQMFDQANLWEEIGYVTVAGELASGRDVILERTVDSSPPFLEEHSDIDDLVDFRVFASAKDQDDWVAASILKNLSEDDLRSDDIVVINTNPLTTRNNLGPIRRRLVDAEIASHLAGVDTSADVFFAPEDESVTFTGIYRAKGNEAGMVYVVNAQECNTTSGNLATVRNRLFTAITRSKAWVRVVGVGPAMQELKDEYEAVKDRMFQLRFRYPTDEQREALRIVHRDMSAAEMRTVQRRRESLGNLLSDLEEGRIFREDLDATTLERLKNLLNPRG